MAHSEKTVGFIGAGNIAQSIIGGMIQQDWQASQIFASAPSQKTRAYISNQFGVVVSDNNIEVAKTDIVFLCVKPHLIRSVLVEIVPVLKGRQSLLISVAAGITMAHLNHLFDVPQAIIRSMPNTPSLVGVGACGLFANSEVTHQQRMMAQAIFQSVGIVEWVEQEDLINTIIAISGSGPAYYFLFMEAMKDAGVSLGLAPEIAERLTIQTALGAAKMALLSDINVTKLRQNVCSPGGTTEQAIRTFQDGGLTNLVKQSMERAVKKAKNMAEELGT
ncbi:MAG: pyrroline-5-carboxylate reductase [Candidatus Endonucleobacter bathymodioli]|uniref:Pyrroline-5-carboxylate reductase n=1 Tax=Candidatus Endonucleibacter bathymodioli TaxID=539814 RepID=A0AA90NK65_9GAMM|nr:pyrroline-5-carboxylate reductase [Candidatus Endonucleobacter bathymodioli]